MKTSKPVLKDNGEAALYKAVAAFLKRQGWSVVVPGGCRVQRQLQPGDLSANYEFVVRFTGTRSVTLTARERRGA